jgi:hypothetical protein
LLLLFMAMVMFFCFPFGIGHALLLLFFMALVALFCCCSLWP